MFSQPDAMTTTTTPLVLAGSPATISAAKGKQPSAEIIAYGGGIMPVPGWGNVAIDLAGLELPPMVPILADHNANLSGIVGQGTPRAANGTLVVAGPLTVSTEAGARVVQLAKEGFSFQASVGVEPLRHEFIAGGQSAEVNGRALVAPREGFKLVRAGRLREVSITAIGCDIETAVSIAASQGTAGMPTPLPENSALSAGYDDLGSMRHARAEEIERQRRISEICASYDNPTQEINGQRVSIEAHAIREGWSYAQADLAAMRAARPQGSFISNHGRAGVDSPAVIEAALLVRAGYHDLAERQLGARAMEQSRSLHSASLMEICRAAVSLEGLTPPSSRNELIRAGLSTRNMPIALGNAANKSILQAYNDARVTWRTFCAIRPAADFKPHTSIRPSFMGDFDLVPPGGDLKHGTAEEATFNWSIDTYGKVFGFSRQDVINDDLGILGEVAPSLGRMAQRAVSDLVYKTFLKNTGPHFAAGKNNLFTGAGSALSYDSLKVALSMMRLQRDDEKHDLDIQPAVMLVPPELELAAKALLESEYMQRAVNEATGNPVQRLVSLAVEPRLSNGKFTGSSATAWYLLAAPLDVPMVVGFLDGRQAPTTEFFGLDHDVNTLGVAFRAYFDFGAALGDHRAAVKAAGA